jgi:hypothetical protein
MLRDSVLEVCADTLAFYKLAVLKARRANTADEVNVTRSETLK